MIPPITPPVPQPNKVAAMMYPARDGPVLRHRDQLAQGEPDGHEQREILKAIECPAKIRGEKRFPLRATE